MHIVVCDDNKQFGEELTEYIRDTVFHSEYYDDSFHIELFSSPKETLKYIQRTNIDILFLDISMPEIDGFEIAEAICENNYGIYLIFVSNLEDRVFSSFKYRPFRFIRKANYKYEVDEALRASVTDMSLKHRCINICNHNDVIPIKISRIVFAEKKKYTNYITIHCLGRSFDYRGTIANFEAEVKGFNFVKPSQNALINLEHVQLIKDRTIMMEGDYKYVVSSPKYYAEVTKKFLEYMRDK